jgi:hypothetical protein
VSPMYWNFDPLISRPNSSLGDKPGCGVRQKAIY